MVWCWCGPTKNYVTPNSSWGSVWLWQLSEPYLVENAKQINSSYKQALYSVGLDFDNFCVEEGNALLKCLLWKLSILQSPYDGGPCYRVCAR